MKGYSTETVETITKQPRKQRCANGARSSKMMSFRIDADNVKFLEGEPNKGYLINKLLTAERERRGKESI